MTKTKLLPILICSIAFFLILSNSTLANNARYYEDVSSTHWAYPSIMKVHNLGIMGEVSVHKFHPKEKVTRAEAAQYLYNALDVKEETSFKMAFKDVPQNASYYKAVQTLTSLGVFQNTTAFKPDRHLTRAELCIVLVHTFSIEVDKINRASFKDVVSKHWAKDHIESLADIGIINGTGKNMFSPTSHITRAELAVILAGTIDFQLKLTSHEMVYDYLQKDYLSVKNLYPHFSEEVVALVNEEREKVGAPILKVDPKLTQLAIIKANDMVKRNYFDHKSPLYGYPWDMAGIFDYPFISLGENIARNYKSPKTVVEGWMKSSSHRSTMLNENYTNIGIACVNGKNGQLYWVQQFSSN
ncbi:S-layer homology domain-containing protein [Lysinibacillus sp. BW-2-10]|uniref:CAP and S-layer homology domain-containing protein n=1 Tax=Lysinibacillus sp. BW-2-10 TaxID=2590030 RepID=UPI00118017A7|nr:S-layer homology domain-containing protein [Lysinibacillus sp. BW-2-10]TSI07353.1 S-layer protein [Lysinibacillus sp. BW-2-10]